MRKRLHAAIPLLMAIFLGSALQGWGQGLETFDNANLTAAYADNSFVGNNGIVWNYTHSRNEDTFPIDGKGLMLRRASDSKLTSGTITGGISSFSLQMRKAFTGTSERQLELYINGELKGTSQIIGTSEPDPTVYLFEVNDINIDGNIVIEIKLVGSTTTNRQTVIDNITWTAFGALPKVLVPTFTPPAGNFYAPIEISMASATEGASIYYTLDGSEPTTASTLYTSPFTLMATTTVKALAVKADMENSSITTAIYNFPEIFEVNSIAELRAATNDGKVYRLNNSAAITFLQSFRNQKYIQDETAGILIDDNSNVIKTLYERYDVLYGLTGTVSTFQNMIQFVPVIDPGESSYNNKINPLIVSLEDYLADPLVYQSRLITLSKVSFDVAEGAKFANGTVYDIKDGAFTGKFRTTFFDVNYIGEDIPEGPWSITGLSNGRTDGQFFTARDLGDFKDMDVVSASVSPDELTVDFDKPENLEFTITWNGATALKYLAVKMLEAPFYEFILEEDEYTLTDNGDGTATLIILFEEGQQGEPGKKNLNKLAYDESYDLRFVFDKGEDYVVKVYFVNVTYEVAFKVTDENAQPLNNAKVSVVDDPNSPYFTNSSGWVYFDLKKGTYNYEVSAGSYIAKSGSFEVVPMEGAEVVVELELLYTTLFQFSAKEGNLPAWFGTDTERGFASHGDKIYVASRKGGLNIQVLDRLSGLQTGTLNTTGIEGGFFGLALNDIEITGDGTVLVANVAGQTNFPDFKVYIVKENEPAQLVLKYTLPTGRTGDKFTVVGNMADGTATIYAADNASKTVYKFTLDENKPEGMLFGAPQVITLGGDTDTNFGNTPVVAPKPDGSFYYTASGRPIYKFEADGTYLGSIPTTLISGSTTGMKYVGKVGNDDLLAIYTFGDGNEKLIFTQLKDGKPEDAEILFITPSMRLNANGNGTGDIAFEAHSDGNADLYVMGSNNGIAGYRTKNMDITFPYYGAPAPKYKATFTVNDADGPITDAIITLDGVAAAAGIYVFEDLIAGKYAYKVNKAGYVEKTGEVDIVDQDVTVAIVLEKVKYTVTFDVKDAQGVAITDAVVTFNGVANAAGNYVVANVLPGTYAYSVAKTGYFTTSVTDLAVAGDLTVPVVLNIDNTSAGGNLVSELRIFPNPAREFVKISAGNRMEQIIVTDITGRVVYNETLSSFEHQLNTSNLDNGIYIMSILTEQGKMVRKFQVRK